MNDRTRDATKAFLDTLRVALYSGATGGTGPMILHLGRTGEPEANQEADLVVAVPDAAGAEESHRLHVRCQLEPLGKRMRLDGEISGTAQSHCHRCLAEFERAVEARFAVILQRGGESDDEDVLVVPEMTDAFDLTPVVREALILEEPIQKLCRSDCRGLCPRCGLDLNAASCGCQPASDPRWAALERLSHEWEP